MPPSSSPSVARRAFLGGAFAAAVGAATTVVTPAHADPLPAPRPTDLIAWHEVDLVGASPYATAVTTDATGSVWYAEGSDLAVVLLDPLGGGRTIFPTGEPSTSLAVTPDGRLWLNSATGPAIGVLDPAVGVVAWHTVPAVATALAVSPTGTVWFADQTHGAIASIDSSGTVTSVTVPGSPSVAGLSVAGDGTVWTWDFGSSDIFRYDPVAGTFAVFTTPLLGVTGLTADASGSVWVGGAGTVLELALDGSTRSTIALPPAPGTPRMLVAGVHAPLYFRVTDLGIGRVNPDRTLTFMLPPFEKAAPMGLAVTPAGSVWFLHRFRETIGWF